jgi:hypothetical protein
VVAPPPPEAGGCPIVFCRNVLIYLRPADATRALEAIGRSMPDHGRLFLGMTETLTPGQGGFVPERHGSAYVYRPDGRQPVRSSVRERAFEPRQRGTAGSRPPTAELLLSLARARLLGGNDARRRSGPRLTRAPVRRARGIPTRRRGADRRSSGSASDTVIGRISGTSGGADMATSVEVGSLRNFIDGEQVEAAEGRTDEVLNPATGEVIAQAPSSSGEDVDRAVTAARRAFGAWSGSTPGERSLALLKIADAIEERGDELAELEAMNAGKPLQAVKDDEIPAIVDNLRFFAGAARDDERDGRRASTSRATPR